MEKDAALKGFYDFMRSEVPCFGFWGDGIHKFLQHNLPFVTYTVYGKEGLRLIQVGCLCLDFFFGGEVVVFVFWKFFNGI